MKELRQRFLSVYSIAMLFFLYVPIVVLVFYSFNESRINAVWSGWTWKWYVSLFSNRQVLDALSNSLIIALATAVIATILGTFAALSFQRYAPRVRAVIDGFLYLPIIIPDILMGLSLLVLFSQIHLSLGKLTIILAHVTFSIPFVVVILTARLTGLGKEQEEAAQDLGATPWQTLRYITLPQIAPGMIASFLLTFTMSLDDFVISFFVAGPNSTTLPLYIYGLVKRGVSPEVNALSTLLVVTTILLVVLAEALRRRGLAKDSADHLPL